MIFPWLNGFVSIFKAPLTWGLIFLNVFLFVGLPGSVEYSQSKIEQKVNSPGFLKVQAFHYLNYLKNNPNPKLNELFAALLKNEESSRDALWIAQASFRDQEFLKVATAMAPYPDQVMQQEWLSAWKDFLSSQGDFKTLSAYGISIFGFQWTSYVTYQFIHSGWLHLLSNMLVLLIFGALVESFFGSAVLGLVYVIGGVVGALFYAQTTGISFAPLVGASGSVSALMGFYLITEIRKNVAYYYFFSPMQGHFGVIYLSKWWIVATAVINDLAALIATPDWLLGVAHTVHLGSAGFGIIVGIGARVYLAKRQASSLRRAQQVNYQPEQNLFA